MLRFLLPPNEHVREFAFTPFPLLASAVSSRGALRTLGTVAGSVITRTIQLPESDFEGLLGIRTARFLLLGLRRGERFKNFFPFHKRRLHPLRGHIYAG